MPCGDYGGELIKAVSGGNFQDAVTCAFINDLGPHVWPLMFAGAFIIGAFALTRSPVPPLVLMLIMGPFIVATLPGVAANLLAIGGLFSVPAVMLLIYTRVKHVR